MSLEGEPAPPRSLAIIPVAHAGVCIVHNDWPPAARAEGSRFRRMSRKVVVDGRRILLREAMKGVEQHVLGG